jgi:two-component system, LytTR family, response regulator
MLLNSFIVEDEKLSRDLLNSMLREHCPQTKVVGEASSADDAYSGIKALHPDLIFLDIEIPFQNGFDLLDRIKSEIQGFQTIFVSGFNQYALKAIKAGAFDYLLKPLDVGELKSAIEKVYQKQVPKMVSEGNFSINKLQNNIIIPHQSGFRIINLKEIIRLEADDNYTYVYIENEPRIVVSKTLKYFEKRLCSEWFFRPHKSHIINLYHFKEYISDDGGYAVMSDNGYVSVARSKAANFHEVLRRLISEHN